MKANFSLLLMFALACGEADAVPDARTPGQGVVVAEVNGQPLYVEDLALVDEATETDVRQRLRAAIDHELLAQAGGVEGKVARAGLRRERQVAVQQYLREQIEASRAPSDVSVDQVKEAYTARANEYDRPAEKASLHFLAKLPKSPTDAQEQAAKRLARDAWEQMTDEKSARALLARNNSREDGIEIVVQHVPRMSKSAAADPAYLDAMFEQPGVGRTRDIVRSGFGWHAIWVTEAWPASFTPLNEVDATLRKDLSVELRRAAVEQLLEKLAATTKTAMNVERVRELLGAVYDKHVRFSDEAELVR